MGAVVRLVSCPFPTTHSLWSRGDRQLGIPPSHESGSSPSAQWHPILMAVVTHPEGWPGVPAEPTLNPDVLQASLPLSFPHPMNRCLLVYTSWGWVSVTPNPRAIITILSWAGWGLSEMMHHGPWLSSVKVLVNDADGGGYYYDSLEHRWAWTSPIYFKVVL